MATTKAQRQQTTVEMIETINRNADKAWTVKISEGRRIAAIKAKEMQDRRDEELTKCAIYFSLGLLIGTICITIALCLMGIHPMQHISL